MNDEAHRAVDGNRQVKNENEEKLRKEYEKQIQKLTLENMIKLLELQKENQALKHDIEIMKLKSKQQQNETEDNNANVREIQELNDRIRELEEEAKQQHGAEGEGGLVQQHFITVKERLLWGAKTYFGGKKPNTNLYASYQEWYDSISKLMLNEKPYASDKFSFPKKNYETTWQNLYFVSKKKDLNTNRIMKKTLWLKG